MVVVTTFPNMLTFVPYNTHLHHPQWPKSSCTIFLSYMACPLPLCGIMIPPWPANFDKIYLNWKAHNWTRAHFIIPKYIIKPRWSIISWKHTYGVLQWTGNTNGFNGYPLLNGGTTPLIIVFPKCHCMKLSMAKNLLQSLHIYYTHPRFKKWILTPE